MKVRWISKALHRMADDLDPVARFPPTMQEIIDDDVYETEIALHKACAEEERARHTVAMLRERLARLYDTTDRMKEQK